MHTKLQQAIYGDLCTLAGLTYDPVMGQYPSGQTAILMHKGEGGSVNLNEMVESHRNEFYLVTGGRPPQHAGSTGRVSVKDVETGAGHDFFPGAFDMEWRALSD